MFELFIYLLLKACYYSAPVVLLLLIGRARVSRIVGQIVLALSFAAATGYMLWRIEWFDVWRHGTPPPPQLAVYACYMAAYGAIGWFLGGVILSRRSPGRQRTLREA